MAFYRGSKWSIKDNALDHQAQREAEERQRELSDLDVYAQAHRKVGSIEGLAAQVGVGKSTLSAYLQMLRGGSPVKPLRALTVAKIKAALRDIAGHPTR